MSDAENHSTSTPCPKCGYCPCCGRGPQTFYPYQWWQVYPWWQTPTYNPPTIQWYSSAGPTRVTSPTTFSAVAN